MLQVTLLKAREAKEVSADSLIQRIIGRNFEYADMIVGRAGYTRIVLSECFITGDPELSGCPGGGVEAHVVVQKIPLLTHRFDVCCSTPPAPPSQRCRRF